MLVATLPGANTTRQTWALQAATVDGRDVLDTPFEIRAGSTPPPIEVHFTNRLTTLTGMFSDQSGRPISDYSLIVFPTRIPFGPRKYSQMTRRWGLFRFLTIETACRTEPNASK